MVSIDRLRKIIRDLDYTIVWESRASTGSHYFEIRRDDYDIQIRVSDHGEVYLPLRPTRRIDINPETGVSLATAKQLLADPASIELVQRREPTPEEREWYRASAREEKRARENFRRNWQALRAQLEPWHWQRWRELGGGRPGAKQLAQEIGYDKPGRMYAALTGGRRP